MQAASAVPAGLAKCRALFAGGVEADPLALSWSEMPDGERRFWLRASRLSESHALRRWREIPEADRCTLKNNLYRAARRAEVILSGGVA